MSHLHPNRLFKFVATLAIVLLTWTIAPPAQAYDNPDLLPDHYTPVIDLANSLTDVQQETLAQQLDEFAALGDINNRTEHQIFVAFALYCAGVPSHLEALNE